MVRENRILLYFATLFGVGLLYALAYTTAERIEQKGKWARLNGTWDQVCTQWGGQLLHDPCSASRICRENRFNDNVEQWLEGGSYDGTPQ